MGWGSDTRGKFTYKGDSKNPQEIEQYKALMGTENLSPVGFMYPLEISTFPFEDTNIWTKIGPVEGGKLPKA
ncbi:hypothetical protein LTR94_004002 [Friedmanniomyces endolithicus]|nr:hypothetical protein LTR94_004002 [Friedmanniomyces endolithicus]